MSWVEVQFWLIFETSERNDLQVMRKRALQAEGRASTSAEAYL